MEKPDIYYVQERAELLPFVPEGTKRALDVGCGEALFSQSVKDKFRAEVWGVEMDDTVAHVAESKLDRVLCGSFLDVREELPEQYFDCIFFNDVLEHMVDPYTVLIQSKQLLIDDGIILCSIPNVRYISNLVEIIVKKDWEYKSGGILDRTHLRFFTLKSIRRMFESLKFDIIRIEGVNGTTSLKYRTLIALTLGFLSDARYLQYACVVKPRLCPGDNPGISA